MNEYRLKSKLNDAICGSGYLKDKTKGKEYSDKCADIFEGQNENKKGTIKAIKYLIKTGMVEYRCDPMGGSSLIQNLIDGIIVITQYGRANLDIQRRDFGALKYKKGAYWVKIGG
jgi:hypothetical protein